MNNLKQCLKEFDIKELRKLKYFLGIEVMHSKQGIFISQQKYMLDLLKETKKMVSVVSQFMHNPEESHLKAVNRRLQYLKGSPTRGILFKRPTCTCVTLKAYTDADYVGSLVNKRSSSGYCTLLGGNLVTWRSKKQNEIARSSTKVEFRSMALGI
ncbi:Copia protein [Gossypium australe]|uniref:Copia protein n=1 Tax=Gossypium australe TaxID=47621 RepID=A0A5B6VAJ5_9ROSI|nr:Copia protein [Gossypium australe]